MEVKDRTANQIMEDMETYTATLYLCLSKDKNLPAIFISSGEIIINDIDKSIDVEAETQIINLKKEDAIKLLILKETFLHAMIQEIENTIKELEKQVE